MKNKMLALMFAGVLALGAVACGGGDDAEDGGTTDTTTEGAEVTS